MKISRQKLSKDPRLARIICELQEEILELNEKIIKQKEKYLKRLSDQETYYETKQKPLWP